MSNIKYTIDTDFKGIAGVKAFHAANTIVRSLYHMAIIFPNKDFFEAVDFFDLLPDEEKRKYIKIGISDGALLNEDEIYSLLIFAKDQNGVPIGKEIIKNLTPFEINEIILEVICEIFKKKVFFCQMSKSN